MKTCIEQLPIELWLSIFSYIEIHDLFRAFSDLNRSFDQLLAFHQLSLYVQFDSTVREKFSWQQSILNRLSRIESCLEKESLELFEFIGSYSKQLIQLKSLVIQTFLQNTASICNALEQLHSLEYIELTCVPTQQLLETLLTLSNLHICRLKLWPPRSNITERLYRSSNVEVLHIKLLGDTNHSILYFLLLNMPKLKYLEFEEKNSMALFRQNLCNFEHLRVLKFIWSSSQYKPGYLENYHKIFSRLRSLYLDVYYFQLDELLNNKLIDFLSTLVTKIKGIKIFIICKLLITIIDNDIQTKFDRCCQRLTMILNNQSNVICQIQWTEVKACKHIIHIISK